MMYNMSVVDWAVDLGWFNTINNNCSINYDVFNGSAVTVIMIFQYIATSLIMCVCSIEAYLFSIAEENVLTDATRCASAFLL